MRCTRCNKNAGHLYNGLCTACMSLNVRKVQREVDDIMNGSMEISGMAHPEDLSKKGGFGAFLSAATTPIKKVNAGSGNKVKMKAVDSTGRKAIKGEFTDKDMRAFSLIFNKLYTKYKVFIDRGEYFICKKSVFGNDGIGGDIIEESRGLIVFKKKAEYDPENIKPDPYAPDDAEIDTDDNDTVDMSDTNLAMLVDIEENMEQ